MAELEQPTSDRVQALLVLVKDPTEKEILHRLQANLNQGARHNHDDVARYNAMWYANEKKGNEEIEVQRKKAEVEKVRREREAKEAEAKPAPKPEPPKLGPHPEPPKVDSTPHRKP